MKAEGFWHINQCWRLLTELWRVEVADWELEGEGCWLRDGGWKLLNEILILKVADKELEAEGCWQSWGWRLLTDRLRLIFDYREVEAEGCQQICVGLRLLTERLRLNVSDWLYPMSWNLIGDDNFVKFFLSFFSLYLQPYTSKLIKDLMRSYLE